MIQIQNLALKAGFRLHFNAKETLINVASLILPLMKEELCQSVNLFVCFLTSPKRLRQLTWP